MKVAPNTKYEASDDTAVSGSLANSSHESSAPNIEEEMKSSIFSSIKFLLILLISLLILISVVILSVIWISCFSSAVGDMSSKMRKEEFEKIVSFTDRILNNVLLVTESVKSQLYSDFDFESMIERHLYRAMKVAERHLPSLTQGVYIGDPFGAFHGFAKLSGEITFYNITPGLQQYYYYCKDFEKSEYCKRGVEPDEIYPPFTSNFVAESASVNPGNPVFTLSYVDPTLPNIVFLTMVSSLTNGVIKPGTNFSFFFAYDMTVVSISEYLVEITKSVHGSSSFIIEKKTDFIIASDHPEVDVATLDDQGEIQRKTVSNFGGQVTKIGNVVYKTFSSFDEIVCNTERVLSLTENIISVHRLCTDEGIDWILVFSVPQWNYIGSMVIGIICAVIGSFIIVSIGIVTGILFSLKIVRPFTNLIQAFEMVSNMELENLHLYKTKFSEVKMLQFHFNSMIERIKMYRKFIPPHLLSQLDANQQVSKEQVDEESTSKFSKSQKETTDEHSSSIGSTLSKRHQSSRGHASNKVANMNMFSLYLERRKVTFVNTYLDGLNEWFIKMNPSDTVSILSDMFEIIGQLAKTSNGQIGKFENETVCIHFNATNDQSQHEMRGLQLCNSLLSKLTNFKETKMKKNSLLEKYKDSLIFESFKVRVVANSQYNLCGNLGTKQVMTFSILGSTPFNLQSMIDTAKEFDVSILISDDLYEKVDNLFQARYVDTKEMVTDQYYTSPHLSNSILFSKRRVYELGESNSITQDEWMYELQAKEKNNRWKKYNDACVHFFNSRYEDAANLLREYMSDLENPDIVAMKLLEHCK